jgi:8-oxo-dGTP diphosphatase
MTGLYVLGFAFRPTVHGIKVILIEKTKPGWMKGRLNGVGGKVEDGEKASAAMAREFEEETGYPSSACSWQYFTEMHFPGDCVVLCYARQLPYDAEVQTTTEECVEELVEKGFHLDPRILDNLLWLVPMARHALQMGMNHTCPHVMKCFVG